MSEISHSGRFQPGHKIGRPKGGISKATLEIKAFCRTLVDSPEYRQKLYDDLSARRLSPAVELMLWDRAYGPVPKEVRIDDVASMGTHDLLDRMRALLSAMPEADVLQDVQLDGIELESNPDRPDDESDPPA